MNLTQLITGEIMVSNTLTVHFRTIYLRRILCILVNIFVYDFNLSQSCQIKDYQESFSKTQNNQYVFLGHHKHGMKVPNSLKGKDPG